MITAAVVVSDYKLYSLEKCLRAILASPEVSCLYINAQTQNPTLYFEILKRLQPSIEVHYDFWNHSKTTWVPDRQYDQDNSARLLSIIIARNMALDFAWRFGANHLLFVDSDVIIKPNGPHRLFAMNKAIAGGLVPGRGAHAHVNYVFHIEEQDGDYIKCAHGTMGYCLLERSVFQFVRFRQGPHPIVQGTNLSEDPCFAADARLIWKVADGWWIDRLARAEHLDNPDNPLTLDGAINDYKVVEP